MKAIASLFIILIFASQFVQGEQIYSFDSIIDANEINHIEFNVLRNLELQFEGFSDGTILFIALDSLNYQLWSELLNYTSINNNTLVGKFDFILFISLKINSTLHLLLINNETIPVVLNLTVEELSTLNEGVPISYFQFIISGIFIILLYKKSIKSS